MSFNATSFWRGFVNSLNDLNSAYRRLMILNGGMEKIEMKLPRLTMKYDSFVNLVSSETKLFFVLPVLFWGGFIASAYVVLGSGHDFRVACSLLWSVFALITVLSMLVNLITQALVIQLPTRELSLKSRFSEFLEQARISDGREKTGLLILGIGKVCLVFCGACALFGGVFVLAIWLMSGGGEWHE